jgi:hypothetical protein
MTTLKKQSVTQQKGKSANKAMHRTAIPLRYIAAGELGRYV